MTTIQIRKDGAAPVEMELDAGVYTIGRSDRCRIHLPDPQVGGRHAILTVTDGGCSIEDFGSDGGTFVNSSKISGETIVVPGCPIVIGPYTIEIKSATSQQPEQVGIVPEPVSPHPTPFKPATVLHDNYDDEMDNMFSVYSDSPSLPALPAPAQDPYAEIKRSIKQQIHRELVERLDIKRLSASRIDAEQLRGRAREVVNSIMGEIRAKLPSSVNPDELGTEIINEAIGLGPLEKFLADDSITEIMVNGPDKIFVERNGKIEYTGQAFMDSNSVMATIERIVAPLGRRIDESQPYVDARLPDGSRVNCIIHPLSLVGPCMTIRKFPKRQLFDKDLFQKGTFTPAMARFLEVCVKARKNIVVSGGTGSGKTTLLNVLSNYLPHDERIVTVEDSAELRLNQPHLVRLESRPPNIEGRGAITIRDLVRNCLRMRPDRIIVGECRGGEALDMLQAMNTGHDGSLTTVHANAPRDVISRLETMVLMSGMELPSRAIREQIASAIDIIVHESRFSDGSRKVTCISEVVGLEGSQITMQDIFVYKQTGISTKGKVQGSFEATGAVPTFYGDLAARGLDLDIAIFQPPQKK